MNAPPLFTSYYAARDLIIGSGLTPIRASIGYPRFKLGYELAGAARLLMPKREWLKLDYDRYRDLYLRQLDAGGVEIVLRELESLQRPGSPGLVLLCFEHLHKPGEWCHRTMLSRWLEEKTGVPVPELGLHRSQSWTQESLFAGLVE